MIIGRAKKDIKKDECITVCCMGGIFSSDDIDITPDGQKHFRNLLDDFMHSGLKMEIEDGSLVLVKDE